MNVELDAEKRLQALVAKDRIRIKEFFIDFDKLRKGHVGEAGVSISELIILFYASDSSSKYLIMAKYIYYSYGIFIHSIFDICYI